MDLELLKHTLLFKASISILDEKEDCFTNEKMATNHVVTTLFYDKSLP
jgi:hypothetical protein